MPENRADIERILAHRKNQVRCVTFGTMAFLLSLVGGAMRISWLVQGGLALFILALVAIVAFGVAASRVRSQSEKT